jgi:hypothetical protein
MTTLDPRILATVTGGGAVATSADPRARGTEVSQFTSALQGLSSFWQSLPSGSRK